MCSYGSGASFLRLERIAVTPLAALLAVALDLAGEVLGHEVDRVDHVLGALARHAA